MTPSHSPDSRVTQADEIAVQILRSKLVGATWSVQNSNEIMKKAFAAHRIAAERAALTRAAQHMAGDYNGGEFDWACCCGATGHWQDGAVDSWKNHILALLPAGESQEPKR